MLRHALFLFTALCTVAPLARAQDSTAAKPPVDTLKKGAYTDEQAERGNAVFTRTCLECHERSDMTNADFRLNWNGRTVFDLFDRIRTTMPEETPGSLPVQEYADVTAYFLKLNGMPTGSMPMPADSSLRDILIEIVAPADSSSSLAFLVRRYDNRTALTPLRSPHRAAAPRYHTQPFRRGS